MPSKPTAIELDFLGLDSRNTTAAAAKSQLRRLFNRQRSFRGLQNAISKINPELLKASMAGSSAGKSDGVIFDSRKSISVPSSPKDLTALPVYTNPGLRSPPEATNNSPVSAPPLTIFYNGTVSVFDLPPHKAETILKLVEEGLIKDPAEEPKSSTTKDWMTQTKRRMLQRNVSLQRFLEKRRERLTATPVQYGNRNQKDMTDV